jgi:large subunit ribosomal protein L30
MSSEAGTERTLKVTLVRSWIGRRSDQETTARSLKLRKLNQTVEVADTPSNRGMIAKIQHLVTVEETQA